MVPERETGRETADLITYSEMHKARKKGSKASDDGLELEIKKQPNSANLNMLSY